MKKLLILVIGLIIFSCSPSDESAIDSYQEAMPIESATIPQELSIGETYEITVTYLRPTTCHAFSDILYQKHDNVRTVVVIGTVFASNGNCTDLNTELEASFDFTPTELGTYIFKLWQGEATNTQGANTEDQYINIEVQVIE